MCWSLSANILRYKIYVCVYEVGVGLRGSHDKQSLLRPEPRLDVTSIFTSNLKGSRTKESVGTSPLLNTQCPSFAPFQCSFVLPLFRFAYSGSGVALFTPFVYTGSGIPNRVEVRTVFISGPRL